jgi:hypothetical protein
VRAWASRQLEASTLVLYNAAQPPLTALIGALITAPKQYSWADALAHAGGTALVLLALGLSACKCSPRRLGSSRSGSLHVGS